MAKAIEFAGALLAAAIIPLTDARATIALSSRPTAHMSCSGGLCSPTAVNAVLNVGDLETMLASGNVAVTTTGANIEADNIRVDAPFAWSSSSTLSLTAYQSILVYRPISVTGMGGVSLTPTGDGGFGELLFAGSGHISFQNLSNMVSVSGKVFALVNSVAGLAQAVAANPAGFYALAADYDASVDGTYSAAPVATTFTGSLEGLGNTISGLSINSGQANGANVGLFATISIASIKDLALKHAKITATGSGNNVGAIVGLNNGFVSHLNSNATVKGGTNSSIGGLVGNNMGSVFATYSTGKVSGDGDVGGLVGFNNALVFESFSGAAVTGGPDVGGLVGSNAGILENCYATGTVAGNSASVAVGGLVGANILDNRMDVSLSFSTGYVTGAPGAYVGGLIGDDVYPGNIVDTYWDTDTSGISNSGQGAGNTSNDPGVEGLTTAQFQAGAAADLDSPVWGLNPEINGGLPYLISYPPPKN